MNTPTPFYQDINHSSPIAELLSMIARRGPLLMRQGGGALSVEHRHRHRRVSQKEREQIMDLRSKGKTIRETAALVGRTYPTTYWVIRDSEKRF